jgi:hypothetical protein
MLPWLSLLPLPEITPSRAKSARTATLLGAAAVFSLALASTATPGRDDIDANLARVPQPWVQTMHQLTFAEYEATLKYWAAKYPGLATLEKRGESHDGSSGPINREISTSRILP